MGQRSQIIVSLPAYFVNEGNSNNKEPRYMVYHNHWLYGYGFVRHLLDILENFEKLRKTWNEGELKRYRIDYEDFIDDAIRCANYKDATNIRRTHKYDESTEWKEYISRLGDWDSFMKSLDNNNGYIFLKVDDKGNIAYDIVNGIEDAEKRERRTPEEYLKLFDIPMGHKDVKGLLQGLETFKRFNHNELKI